MPDAVSSRRIESACHCGNIRVSLFWPGPWPAIPVRACGCRLCRKHAAVWTSHAKGTFELAIADLGQTQRYQFGSKTADFHVCSRCGVIPIVTSLIDGRRYAVFNANTFENVDRSQFIVSASDFEGESTNERLARRQKNWTPEVGADGAA